MFDYLLALLRALLGSLLSLFGRIPAAQFLRDWLEDGLQRFNPVAAFFAVCLVAILGTAAAVVFFWILRRHPGTGKRARILAEVLPFEAPHPRAPEAARREDNLVG